MLTTPAQFWLLFALSLVGITNTVYLSAHVFSKKPVACWFFPAEWCRKVQYSRWSKTFGIPNPFAGLAFYLTIFVLTLLHGWGFASFTPLAVVVIVGFLFSIYFTVIQAFVLRAFCTWCVLSAIDFLLLAAAVGWVLWS